MVRQIEELLLLTCLGGFVAGITYAVTLLRYKRRQHLEPNIDLMSRRRCGRAPFDFASKEFRANAREFLGGGLMGGGADGFENRGASRAGSQGGTVAPAGGNTCAPRSARLALKARGPGNTGPELLQPALRATSVGSC
jgi:hypothetical protein